MDVDIAPVGPMPTLAQRLQIGSPDGSEARESGNTRCEFTLQKALAA